MTIYCTPIQLRYGVTPSDVWTFLGQFKISIYHENYDKLQPNQSLEGIFSCSVLYSIYYVCFAFLTGKTSTSMSYHLNGIKTVSLLINFVLRNQH